MVAAASVAHFLRIFTEDWVQLNAADRVGETSELSFDASVMNMFMAWKAGAALHILPATQTLAPGHFISRAGLTTIFLMPSVAAFMLAVKNVPEDGFPALRYTLMGGEAMSSSTARAWRQAVPNSVIYNLYGPTETTVACSAQKVTDPLVVTPERDSLALGLPLPGTRAGIVDEAMNFLPPGQTGELALAGIQLALGYLDDSQLTAQRFPLLGGERWYLSGDRAYRDDSGILHLLGRTDNQCKVLGHRIELEEVETALRTATHSESVAAVAWPLRNGSALGIVAFVSGTERNPAEIRQLLQRRLPVYALPSRVICRSALPLTANGKVDRSALTDWLESSQQ
jgi:non-ribosomal peptide synthetase component F